jgi:hypothetical protein
MSVRAVWPLKQFGPKNRIALTCASIGPDAAFSSTSSLSPTSPVPSTSATCYLLTKALPAKEHASLAPLCAHCPSSSPSLPWLFCHLPRTMNFFIHVLCATLLFCTSFSNRECPGGGCVGVYSPHHSARPFPSRPFLHSTPPTTSSSYHPSSCCLTTSSPSDFLRPVLRSLVPPSLLLSCAPLCCPCMARRAALPPAWCSAPCCPRASAAARGSTSDEPEATKSPGVPPV